MMAGAATGVTELTIAAARDALAKGELSARELTEAHIAAVEAVRPLNAFITETPEKALDMAEASDARRRAGTARTEYEKVHSSPPVTPDRSAAPHARWRSWRRSWRPS